MNLTLVQDGRHRCEMGYRFNTAVELCAKIRAGELSSVEALSGQIAQIKALDDAINAVVVRDFERALEQARAADRKRSGMCTENLGRLHGLPLTVKESFNVSGLATTWGMVPYRDNVAHQSAEVILRLDAAGAIVFGKTNVPDGVADHQTFSSLFGRTNNPWDVRLTCGGSSGGSAAALAAGFTSVEVGSDLGGSLRVPAHFCGVYSHRPTYGLVPQTGHSLSGKSATTDITVIGPMARSVPDLMLLLDVLMGPDEFDAPGWKVELPRPRAEKLNDFRVAVLANHRACEVDQGIQASIVNLSETLRRAGANVSEKVEWPIDLDVCHQDYVVMARAVALRHSSKEQLQRLIDEMHPQDGSNFSYRTATRCAAGLTHHAWHVLNERRQAFRLAWRRFFRSYDVVLCPVHASQAFVHDLDSPRENRMIQVNGHFQDYNSSLFWLAIAGLNYLPVTVRPVGLANGLPIGVQIIGPYLEDLTTLRFAELLEEICPRPAYPFERQKIQGGLDFEEGRL